MSSLRSSNISYDVVSGRQDLEIFLVKHQHLKKTIFERKLNQSIRNGDINPTEERFIMKLYDKKLSFPNHFYITIVEYKQLKEGTLPQKISTKNIFSKQKIESLMKVINNPNPDKVLRSHGKQTSIENLNSKIYYIKLLTYMQHVTSDLALGKFNFNYKNPLPHMTDVFKYESTTVLASINNFIKYQFIRKLEEYTNIIFNTLFDSVYKRIINTNTPLYKFKSYRQAKRGLKKLKHKIKNYLCMGTVNRNEIDIKNKAIKDFIMNARLFLPKETEILMNSHCYHIQSKENVQEYYINLLHYNNNLEILGMKKITTLPSTSSLITRNIPIDSDLFKKLTLPYKNRRKIDKRSCWEKNSKLNMNSGKKYEFDHTILSNGTTASVRYIHKDDYKSNEARIKSRTRGRTNAAKRSYQNRRVKKEEEEYQNNIQFEDHVKQFNIKKKKRKTATISEEKKSKRKFLFPHIGDMNEEEKQHFKKIIRDILSDDYTTNNNNHDDNISNSCDNLLGADDTTNNTNHDDKRTTLDRLLSQLKNITSREWENAVGDDTDNKNNKTSAGDNARMLNKVNILYSDPGVRDLIYGIPLDKNIVEIKSDGKLIMKQKIDDKSIKFIYSAAQRNFDTRSQLMETKNLNLKKRLGIIKIEKEKLKLLQKFKLSKKTSNIQNYIRYICINNYYANKLLPLYKNRKFLNFRFTRYVMKQKANAKLVNQLKQKFGPNLIIISGDASITHCMRGRKTVPTIGLLKMLSHHFKIYFLDEYRTSKVCYRDWSQEVKPWYIKEFKTSSYSVKTYQMKNKVTDGDIKTTSCINRDHNAVLNFINIFINHLNGKGRPKEFQPKARPAAGERKNNSQSNEEGITHRPRKKQRTTGSRKSKRKKTNTPPTTTTNTPPPTTTTTRSGRVSKRPKFDYYSDN